MQTKVRVAVVIPAYNEAQAIKKVVRGVISEFAKSPYKYRLIVVDDGSRDDTARLANEAGAHVVSHILNSGHGGAAATGLSYARRNDFDIAAMLDGDGQHDPADLLRGIQVMLNGDADLLIGSRLIKKVGMSKTKVIGNRGLSLITYLLFAIRVTDSQSGMRIFSKKAVNGLKWKSTGYEFCSEMVWRAKQRGLKIAEYPIKAIYTNYSEAKGQNNWNAFNIIKSLFKSRLMELFGE